MMPNNKKKVVAVTGGIASGKNIVGDIIKECGYDVFDCDTITHELNKKGMPCYNVIIKTFGNGFLDNSGELDKKAFSKFVFADKKNVELLNKITHPLIFEEIDKKIVNAKSNFVFVLIPLLFETNMQNNFYKIWTVSADEETRINRAINRDNITRQQAKNIIKNQISEIERNKLADTIIYNDRTVKELKDNILNALKNLE